MKESGFELKQLVRHLSETLNKNNVWHLEETQLMFIDFHKAYDAVPVNK